MLSTLLAGLITRYDRVEVLSGFINGLFLVVIAIFVFTEALARLFEPPDVKTERLLVLSVDGVLSYRYPHLWSHTSTKVMATLHVQISPGAIEQRIISQVSSILKGSCVHSVTVQAEKESYFYHMSGLGASFDQTLPVTYSANKAYFAEPAKVI
nr:hypothetical protein BaRGS_002534 [Batillaria attramentaria]